jgi:hypothetical protein
MFTTLVIRICQDEESVLEDAQVVVLEEDVCDRRVGIGEIVDDLDTDCMPVFFRTRKTRYRQPTYDSGRYPRYLLGCV